MQLFLEIALTIAAWRKGWGMRALLPLAIYFGTALLIVLAVATSGGSIEDVSVLATLCDFGLVIALGILACRAPRPLAPQAITNTQVQTGGAREMELHFDR